MLIVGTPLWLAATNSYVVASGPGGAGVVVDVPPEVDRLGTVLRRHEIHPVAFIATHGHIDHVGGAGQAVREHGSTLYVHPYDDFLTDDPAAQLRLLFGGVPAGDFQPPKERQALSNGMTLDLAGLRFEVRHTPGHTPGHCCLYLHDEGVLFSGDQLFAGSIGRTDLPGGDLAALLDSMKRRVLDLPDDVRVLPGHGAETTIGQERRTNPFLQGIG